MKIGKELMDDPEFKRRLESGEYEVAEASAAKAVDNHRSALLSIIIFVLTTVAIVVFGSVPSLRPSFTNAVGEVIGMDMSHIIEILMLSAAAIILLLTKTSGSKAAHSSVFLAGMQAVVAIFGIAWMGDTFIAGNMTELRGSIEHIVTEMPWLFGVALFVMSILLFSQAATIRSLLPLGIALGISPYMLIALFPAVNGYFFIPNYPTVVAAINFDRTGTTRIGKYILNHSFMLPGLIATIVSIGVGMLIIQFC
jgi:anaerobic C4-dicarboxylate transporter DcuA/anaerobic C4-dicarboxylate transporter DcuB